MVFTIVIQIAGCRVSANGEVDMNKAIYISSPFRRGDREQNFERAGWLARKYLAEGDIPISPHYSCGFMDPEIEHELAMDWCLGVIPLCDELHAWYEKDLGPSEGIKEEIDWARWEGIPVKIFHFEEVAK